MVTLVCSIKYPLFENDVWFQLLRVKGLYKKEFKIYELKEGSIIRILA